jgi:hypothetical protein
MTSIRKRRRQIHGLTYGPARSSGFVMYIPPDPEQERQEFLRQLMAPAPDIEGPRRPLMRGEIGTLDCGFRFITSPDLP